VNHKIRCRWSVCFSACLSYKYRKNKFWSEFRKVWNRKD